MRYRLLKPKWGKKFLRQDVPNPDFVREVRGADVMEGCFDKDFLKQKNEAGYQIYYLPNHSSEEFPDGFFTQGKNVDVFDWCMVDMDLKDKIYESKEAFLERVKLFPLKPTFAVDSGYGIHVYWRITDIDSNPEIYMALQKALISEFKTDGSIWTPMQLMRMWGYFNTKNPNESRLATRIKAFESDAQYTVEEFSGALPEISEKDQADIKLHMDKLLGKVDVKISESLSEDLPEKFVRLMESNEYVEKLFKTPKEIKADRSSADMALANFLIGKEAEFTREEVLSVLINTEKARTKNGNTRYEYAFHTLDKACRDCTDLAAPNAHEASQIQDSSDGLGDLVQGPYFLDSLHKRWRKKQMLGLIAGSGVGKTSLSLKIFQEFIRNNKDNDDVFFFFSLEMTSGEILDRWRALVGDDQKAFERLYVVGLNFFEKNLEGSGPNVQNIYRVVRDTCNRVNRKPAVLCIDHIDAMEGDFDLGVKPTFNAENSKYIERRIGKHTVLLSKDGVCQKLKTMCQKLNCFLIVQSQTTKAKDDGGDQPIGKNAAFGTSKFEWYCDYVVGVWRPLNRVMDHCKTANLFVTAYQYAKIREQNPDKDELGLNEHKLIKFNPETQDFLGLTDEDKDKFDELIEIAIKLKEVENKKQNKKYTKAPIQRLRMLVNNAKVAGAKDEA